MKGLVAGLLIGSLAGLAAGLVFLGDDRPEGDDEVSTKRVAARPVRPAEAGVPQASTEGPGGAPSGESPSEPPAGSTGRERVEARAGAGAGATASGGEDAYATKRAELITTLRDIADRSEPLDYRVHLEVRGMLWDLWRMRRGADDQHELDLPRDALDVLLGLREAGAELVNKWSTERIARELAEAAARPAGEPRDPRWDLSFLMVSHLRANGGGDAALVDALLAHGDERMRRSGIELSATIDLPAYDALVALAVDDTRPELQRRALVAMRARADESDTARRALLRAISTVAQSSRAEPESRANAIGSLRAVGREGLPTAVALLREGGLPRGLEVEVVHRVIEFGGARDIASVPLSPNGTLALLTGLCDEDDPDAALLRELRPRALDAARVDGFENSEIVRGYARAGDTELASIIARDRQLPVESRAAAALDLCRTRDQLAQGIALADALADEQTESVEMRRTIAGWLSQLTENGDAATRGEAVSLAKRIIKRDSNYWVRAAAINVVASAAADES